MLKLSIEKIDEYLYTLIDSNGKRYNLNIEFYGFVPEVGDIAYLNEKNVIENNLYNYGPINSKYTREDEEDIIKIVHGDNMIYLQRYYG